jgi:hypothetical protein
MLPLILSLCLAAQASPTPSAPPQAELWLAAGQSQMVGFNGGFGYRDESPGGPDRLPENVWMLDLDNLLVPARQPLASPMNELALQGQHDNVSPAIRFLRRRAEASPDRRIVVVMVASNGSGVTQALPDRNWAAEGSSLKSPDNLYDRLVSRTDAALEQLGLDAPSGLLWAQGESDSFLGAAGYGPEFGLIVSGLRQRFDPELPVLLAGIPNSSELFFPGVLKIDQFFQNIAESDPHVAYVRADGFETVDFLHYDGPSCREFGDRFAENSFALVPPSGSGATDPAGEEALGLPGALPEVGLMLRQRAAGSAEATLFSSVSAAAGLGPAPAGQFNRLGEFERFRQADGFFHLELVWFKDGTERARVRWQQRSNPMTTPRDRVEDFAYRHDSPTTFLPKQFAGLCRTTIPGALLTVRPRWTAWGSGPDLVKFQSLPSVQFDPSFSVLGLMPNGLVYDRVRLDALAPIP